MNINKFLLPMHFPVLSTFNFIILLPVGFYLKLKVKKLKEHVVYSFLQKVHFTKKNIFKESLFIAAVKLFSSIF